MKTSFFAVLFSLTLVAAPAWALTDQPPPQQQEQMQPPQGMPYPGYRMMGRGMGMGPGMMGRRGMGPNMRRHWGMGRMGMMPPCMMGSCWQAGGRGFGMGHMGTMRRSGPQWIVRNAFCELTGYQMNAASLGLNANQRERIETIEEDLSTAAIKARADLQIAAIDLRRAMAKETPDLTKAGAVIDRTGKMWTGLQKTAIKAVAEARKVLTPEQRQKAQEMTLRARPMMMRMQPAPMERDNEEPSGPGM